MARRLRNAAHRNRHGRMLLVLTGTIAGFAALLHMYPSRNSGRGTPRHTPSAVAIETGYEHKDISARSTALVLAAMAATTALVVGVVFTMVWRFNIAYQQPWSRLSQEQVARTVPPAPHLQTDPFRALAQLDAREQRMLHSYGWTAADHSTARIPIERAMALSVGKSLDAPP